MMDQYVADQVAEVIAQHGESMTLNRDGETSIDLKGKRIGGALAAVGNTDQERLRVKIGTAELAASDWASKEPSAGGDGAGDTLTIGGRAYNVLDVRPLRDGETVALYELDVAGG